MECGGSTPLSDGWRVAPGESGVKPPHSKRGITKRAHKRIKGVPKTATPPEPQNADAAVADLPPEFVAAGRRKLAAFVAAARAAGGNLLVLCHSDADGLTTGAILALALRRAGLTVEIVATGKGGSAWSDETAALLKERRPVALIVGDLGVRAELVSPAGVPTFFIDHHRPSGLPPDAETHVVTGYGLEPTPTSGLIAFACVGGLEGVNVDDLDWIAAISVLGDIGDKAPFAVLPPAKKRYGAGVLRDATTLLNAPRRATTGDASGALALLMSVGHPKEISGDRPEAAALRRDKEEVNAAYAEAKKAGPKFAGPAAAIRIHTPCQVHPLVAQIWRTRLPKLIVMGVNTGYRPGWVHFSARCGRETNLLDFFRAHRPEGADSRSYGQGHDQAGGGALPTAVWNTFARELGFGPEMQVVDGEASVAPKKNLPAAVQADLL